MHFLATAVAEQANPFTATPGMSWWQTAGGLLIVFGLLVVCMKLLGKFQRRTAQNRATLLTVWNLGPRREIQVLRLGEEVHYIYRHDGAMVLLKQEAFSVWEASAEQTNPASPSNLGNLMGRVIPSLKAPSPAKSYESRA